MQSAFDYVENFRGGRHLKLRECPVFLMDSVVDRYQEDWSYIDYEIEWTNGLDASDWTDDNTPLPVRYAIG